MGFSTKQMSALQRNPDQRNVKTREVNGRSLSYIEGWHAISEANRIFGFDAWNRETAESKCVLARENRGTFHAVYTARVRITVQADGSIVIREGHGTGEGRGSSPGEVHDLALKAAETDATKRALATFGRPFGLALYGSGKSTAVAKTASPGLVPNDQALNHRMPPDDTTPIPRPSRYYGRSQDVVTKDTAHARQQPQVQPPTDMPIAPTSLDPKQARIDKSVLTISEPKRHRDKTHLRFVGSHPCIVCGRQPSDAHHLRFAQPRALGMKVSDEFTVPLCREHHWQLHHAGNEQAWWHNLSIKPLPIALDLWTESMSGAIPTNS